MLPFEQIAFAGLASFDTIFNPPCIQSPLNGSRNVSNNFFFRFPVQLHLGVRPHFPVNVSKAYQQSGGCISGPVTLLACLPESQS